MEKLENIVIVGAGPAGCAAAVQCTRLGVKPILIEREGHCGGLIRHAFLVENYPGISPARGHYVAGLLEEFIARFNVSLLHASVSDISLSNGVNFSVRGDFGSLSAKCVMLAVGTVPIALDIPGNQSVSDTVFYSATELLDSLSEPKHVAVVGGGEAALDYALSLHAAGVQVTILVRSLTLRARGRLISLIKSRAEIEIRYGYRIENFRSGEYGTELTITEGSRTSVLDVDGIVCAIGRYSAAPDLLRAAGDEFVTPPYPKGFYLIGDANHGTLGQMGIAIGDGISAAPERHSGPGELRTAMNCQLLPINRSGNRFVAHLSIE